jgi:hypothetical protein
MALCRDPAIPLFNSGIFDLKMARGILSLDDKNMNCFYKDVATFTIAHRPIESEPRGNEILMNHATGSFAWSRTNEEYIRHLKIGYNAPNLSASKAAVGRAPVYISTILGQQHELVRLTTLKYSSKKGNQVTLR